MGLYKRNTSNALHHFPTLQSLITIYKQEEKCCSEKSNFFITLLKMGKSFEFCKNAKKQAK